MKFPSQPCHQLRQLFLLLLLPTASIALKQSKLQSMFQLHAPRTSGACFDYSPNGVPLMPYVLSAVGDAMEIATEVQFAMDQSAFPTPPGKRMRGLLYLFFGITFGAERQPSPASLADFTDVKGTRLSLRRPSLEDVEFADWLDRGFSTSSGIISYADTDSDKTAMVSLL